MTERIHIDSSLTTLVDLKDAFFQVGAEGLTLQEKKVQFALWALLKSPLVLSGDLGQFTEEELKLVKNEEVIAVNQDADGVPGDQVWKRGPYEVSPDFHV